MQGEDQKKLDVITNDLLKRALRFTGRLGVLASEQEDVPVSLPIVTQNLGYLRLEVLTSLPCRQSKISGRLDRECRI
jgi:hypothetical protein